MNGALASLSINTSPAKLSLHHSFQKEVACIPCACTSRARVQQHRQEESAGAPVCSLEKSRGKPQLCAQKQTGSQEIKVHHGLAAKPSSMQTNTTESSTL
eukprot:CAMPEP_0206496920 /NCGR_PEP_ID=MMETSP0324_2-20121206/49798_1 /ASSEMBLY_ACC=CAM_ASM_000836 /TAXON_ID=2866 /ORGANISM="Crypthecodinium cohnii, Strain Seligo" /LENGTH=99 /DNA_ID=CAMNT_0053982233 /DNA_START=181 /DNA_END=477 /DNA_ORIENTATION=+